MVTSPFFNNYAHHGEQSLLDALVVEAIQIYGQDMLYIPIKKGSLDGLFYEDDTSYYDDYYTLEMYVRSYDGFQGQQTFMSTIGLEIRDQLVLSVSRSRFNDEVTSKVPTQFRPYEGDLIYFPSNNKLFKILFVDDKPFFYQHGTLQMYDMTCELFEYSSETLNTGIPEVDRLQKEYSTNVFDFEMTLEDGTRLVSEGDNMVIVQESYNYNEDDDPIQDNDRIQDEVVANNIFVWDEDNPFAANTPW